MAREALGRKLSGSLFRPQQQLPLKQNHIHRRKQPRRQLFLFSYFRLSAHVPARIQNHFYVKKSEPTDMSTLFLTPTVSSRAFYSDSFSEFVFSFFFFFSFSENSCRHSGAEQREPAEFDDTGERLDSERDTPEAKQPRGAAGERPQPATSPRTLPQSEASATS